MGAKAPSAHPSRGPYSGFALSKIKPSGDRQFLETVDEFSDKLRYLEVTVSEQLCLRCIKSTFVIIAFFKKRQNYSS